MRPPGKTKHLKEDGDSVLPLPEGRKVMNMSEERLICISCKKDISNSRGSVRFKCPECSKYEIIRCRHCREIAAQYKCPECGFTGPN